MSSSVPVQQGGVVLVTQMYPTPQSGVVCNPIPQQMCTGTSTFSRVHPFALGTVQIMIGLMVFLCGVVAVVDADSLAVFSGSFVWGAGFYITSGSLTVAAGKSSNRCLMNTTLAFNVIATMAAGVAIILYMLDATVMTYCYPNGSYECWKFTTQRQGISGALTVFHFLEFIITIVVSAFACKSTCTCCHEQQPVYIVPGNAPMAPQAQPSYYAPPTVVQPPPQGLPTYPAATTSMAHAPAQRFPGLTDPPPYSGEKDALLEYEI